MCKVEIRVPTHPGLLQGLGESMLTVAPGPGNMCGQWQPFSLFLLFMGEEREEQAAWLPGESAPPPSLLGSINSFHIKH